MATFKFVRKIEKNYLIESFYDMSLEARPRTGDITLENSQTKIKGLRANPEKPQFKVHGIERIFNFFEQKSSMY